MGCGQAPSGQLTVDQLRGKRRALPPQRADPERGQGDAEGKTTAAPPSCRTSLRFPECHCRLKLLRRRRFPIKLVKAKDTERKLSLRPQIIWVDEIGRASGRERVCQ